MNRVKLKEICRLINGRAYKQNELLDIGKYPVLRVGNFFSDKGYYYSDLELEADKYCDNGDLLFAWSASFGPKIWNGGKAIYHYHIWKMELSEKVDKRYFYYYLYYLSEKIKNEGHGGIMIHTTKAEMEEREFYLLEISKQKQISNLLAKIEKVIDNRKQQLQQLDDLVKARFVELFGDPNANLMKWEKEQLQVNATLLNGRAYKQDELLDNGKYPVLRVGNFFSNRGWYYSDLELDEDKYCDDGDLLYAWSASFGPRIWNGGKVIYHYHIWKVLVGEKYNKQFLCHLLDYATASFMGDTHGIGMMHLTKSGMEETEFIVPPIDLQNQFAAFVEQVDKSKVAVQKALDEAQTLFDSLMQEYFG